MMIRKSLLAFTVGIALALPSGALGHDGHGKKVLGTVTMAAADHVMVKTSDGKEQTIAVNAKTKILKGKTVVKSEELATGTRVVITLTPKEPPTAAEIQVGAAPKSEQTKK